MSSPVTAFTPAVGANGSPCTSALAPAGSSVNAVLPVEAPNVQVYNSSTTAIHICFGNGALVAVAATPGSPTNCIPIPPGACMVLAIPATANVWAAVGTGTIYGTFGEGL